MPVACSRQEIATAIGFSRNLLRSDEVNGTDRRGIDLTAQSCGRLLPVQSRARCLRLT